MFNVNAADQSSESDTPPPPSPGISDGKGPMRPIPQEAITACKGKAEGATCAAVRGGAGKCYYTPDKKYFACKPDHRGPGPLDPAQSK